jgi:ATP phosphoribosyltransferase
VRPRAPRPPCPLPLLTCALLGTAGRLYEKCLELLAGADIQFKRAHRLDVALVQNHPMAL